ncbi:MAG TPA: hypothetical protein VH854_01715 [Thermoanaerobaculia bacterium]|jgi:hypothetical protein|nr:hypothetical protein [Thermoanaerobaculia bacterium]
MIRFVRTEVHRFPRFTAAAAALCLIAVTSTATGAAHMSARKLPTLKPTFTAAAAFDVSDSVRNISLHPSARLPMIPSTEVQEMEVRPEGGPEKAPYRGHTPDAALQATSPTRRSLAIPSTLQNFEGVSNEDNFTIYGGRVAPPDPIGAVGPNHYVEMINLVFAVYDKTGSRLAGPIPLGALWENFAIPDCTDPSGDPVVLYDKLEDRWILSQFTTSGLSDPTRPFWNCVAVSVNGDPTGAYYRYAFETTVNDTFYFPDYPKYGNWKKSYVLTSRDFGPTVEYGISVYALEKNRMIAGDPKARMVHFFLDSNVVPLELIGDGLLPADFDGTKQPAESAPIPIVGTQDDGAGYGATFDALNVWEMSIHWNARPDASIRLATQLPVASFDSIFPCFGADGRGCLPEPGVVDKERWLDVLSYRQRPTWRLAYRNFGGYESMVTNQSVEASPGTAGVRWYEIRRSQTGTYSLTQQGTYAPADGVNRWMGSIAQDKKGNMALGYSVVDATSVKPGIRYTGRLAGDPAGQMTQGEGTVINGTGVQLTTNSRWGDYTSMNVDPTDDCTFWYVNEYYQIDGIIGVNTAPWQTRIGSFKLPGCSGP